MAKRVLLVSYHSPPAINAESILVWKTVQALSHDFDVHIVTSNIHTGARIDAQMSFPTNVQVLRKSARKPQNEFLHKATDKLLSIFTDEQYLWAKHLDKRLRTFMDCDVIYSRSQPGSSHILAHKIKTLTKKPWVAQFSDPWANNPYHQNHSFIRKSFNRSWERLVVQDADILIFPTHEIRDMYVQAYDSWNINHKSVILPHHFTPEMYPHTLQQSSEGKPTFTFAYFGDFYGARSPDPFLAGLQQIVADSPHLLNKIQVQFIGNVEGKFEQIIRNCPIPIRRSTVSYTESLQWMTKSDVLLLIDAPSENGVNPFLASKLIDYLGAGKPILGITDTKGTAADILRNHGHLVVSPHDREGIATAIQNCLTPRQVQIHPPKEFTTKTVVSRLASIINQL